MSPKYLNYRYINLKLIQFLCQSCHAVLKIYMWRCYISSGNMISYWFFIKCCFSRVETVDDLIEGQIMKDRKRCIMQIMANHTEKCCLHKQISVSYIPQVITQKKSLKYSNRSCVKCISGLCLLINSHVKFSSSV